MLHQATLLYVLNHDREVVLPDVGHDLLGEKKVPMSALDMISVSAMAVFTVGAALLRDLRLWCKVFLCCGFLFFLKGLCDYLTDLPDSSGWDNCAARLGPSSVEYFRGFGNVTGFAYWSRLCELEVYGVAGKWPVRYCADMILSGHTFVMFLFLLGSADLLRKIRLVVRKSFRTTMQIVEAVVNVMIIVCAFSDLYLIIVNHFHYTVDVVLAIVVTLLLYTNAGVAVLTDWWVEWMETKKYGRMTPDNGAVWIPPLLLPCCWFQGFYTVKRMKEKAVRERMQKNFRWPVDQSGSFDAERGFENDDSSEDSSEGEDSSFETSSEGSQEGALSASEVAKIA